MENESQPSQAWKGKSKTGALGYRIFVFILRLAGIRISYFVLRFVALYYFLFSYSSSRPMYRFYRRMGYSIFGALAALYKNYYQFGQTLIDKVAVIAGIPNRFSFDFDGEENLHAIVAEKKGGLLMSAHVGNWEAAGQLLQRLNTTINIVMFDGENAQIKEYLEKVTGRKSFNVIYVKNDLSHIYQISEALSRNELVCMHSDRFLPGNKTLSASFLGEEAKFPEGPFVLALRLKVPIVYVYGFKESPGHYHFYSTPIKRMDRSKGDTTQTILDDYVRNLEQMIRRYPHQWFNYYDFWR